MCFHCRRRLARHESRRARETRGAGPTRWAGLAPRRLVEGLGYLWSFMASGEVSTRGTDASAARWAISRVAANLYSRTASGSLADVLALAQCSREYCVER